MMKKLLLTLCLAFSMVVLANAQDTPKKPTAFVWNKANLTEIGCDADQVKKIIAIGKEASAKAKQIKEDTSLDEKAQKAAIRAATKERNEARSALLTDDQKEKIKEIDAKLKVEAKAAASN